MSEGEQPGPGPGERSEGGERKRKDSPERPAQVGGARVWFYVSSYNCRVKVSTKSCSSMHVVMPHASRGCGEHIFKSVSCYEARPPSHLCYAVCALYRN